MRAIRTKQDVEFHSDSWAHSARPAVNVKIYDFDAPREHEFYSAAFTREDAEAMLEREEWLFGAACESKWEDLQSDAEEIFDHYDVKVWSEGRSGGWAVVDGLPDVEDWDAVLLSKWAKFARYARAQADDVPYTMVWLGYVNTIEPELEANDKAQREFEQVHAWGMV